MPQPTTIPRVLASLALVVSLATAAAAAPVSFDTSLVAFADAAGTVTIDLHWDEALVLVFGGDQGFVAEVIVPNTDTSAYQTSALGRIDPGTAATRSGLIEAIGSGLVVTHDATDLRGLQASYTQRLNALGFDVQADAANPRTLHAVLGEHAYRLVFGYQEGGGIRTYIGS